MLPPLGTVCAAWRRLCRPSKARGARCCAPVAGSGSGSNGFVDGAGGNATFDYPYGVAIDPSGDFALVVVRRPPPYTPAWRHPADGSTPALHTA